MAPANAKLLERAWPIVLDEHICRRKEAEEQALALTRLEIIAMLRFPRLQLTK